MAGTLVYMAPELPRGEPATVRWDLYGVGVLIYRPVTGWYPLTVRTLAELREGHAAGRAVWLSDVRRQGRKRPLVNAANRRPNGLKTNG